MNVFPDFDGLSGITDLARVIGALLTVVLMVAVAMLIISAIIWAVSASGGNYHAATRGRTGVLVSLGAAILAGSAVAWVNWLIDLGQRI